MSITLDGRVAVVTGAGGGLGRAHALELARRGAGVVVNDVGGSLSGDGGDPGAADRVVAEITAAGGRAVAAYDSVATPEGGAAIVATALEAYDRLDIVVNNAGILRDRSFGKLEWADVDAVLDVHLRGAFHVSKPAFQAMRERGHGRFVFTSSNAGVFGNFGQSAYGAAKAGLVGLSNVLAIEGARVGVTSNVICPIARTRMTERVLGDDLAAALRPEDVSPLVAYLASDECTLTHRVFSAGGGHFAEVFTGLTPGWQAGPDAPTSEDLADHLDTICARDGYSTPLSSEDEIRMLREAFAGAGSVVPS